jgi:hypothetical protein
MATVGGVDQVYELCLLDSLYSNFDQFDAFVQNNINQYGTSQNDYRFSTVFSADGGTYDNNIAMENRAKEWVEDAARKEILYIDNSNASLSISAIQNFSLIFKYTDYEHEEIPRNMFYDFLIGAV